MIMHPRESKGCEEKEGKEGWAKTNQRRAKAQRKQNGSQRSQGNQKGDEIKNKNGHCSDAHGDLPRSPPLQAQQPGEALQTYPGVMLQAQETKAKQGNPRRTLVQCLCKAFKAVYAYLATPATTLQEDQTLVLKADKAVILKETQGKDCLASTATESLLDPHRTLVQGPQAYSNTLQEPITAILEGTTAQSCLASSATRSLQAPTQVTTIPLRHRLQPEHKVCHNTEHYL